MCRKILLDISAVEKQRPYKDMHTETTDCPCRKSLLVQKQDLRKLCIHKPPIARAGRVYLCRSKTLGSYAYTNPRLPVQEEFTCAEARP